MLPAVEQAFNQPSREFRAHLGSQMCAWWQQLQVAERHRLLILIRPRRNSSSTARNVATTSSMVSPAIDTERDRELGAGVEDARAPLVDARAGDAGSSICVGWGSAVKRRHTASRASGPTGSSGAGSMRPGRLARRRVHAVRRVARGRAGLRPRRGRRGRSPDVRPGPRPLLRLPRQALRSAAARAT